MHVALFPLSVVFASGCTFATGDDGDDGPIGLLRDGEASAGSGAAGGGGAPTSLPNAMAPQPSQTPAGDPESGKLKGMTFAHNLVRAMIGGANPPPPLVWDPDIAKMAQAYADELAKTCAFEHSKGSFGENLARFGSTASQGPEATGVDAVSNWAEEFSCYTFGPFMKGDQCNSECDESGGCGHYTQIVWRKTQKLGCGVATCNDGRFTHDTYVCNYSPPGNFIGQIPY